MMHPIVRAIAGVVLAAGWAPCGAQDVGEVRVTVVDGGTGQGVAGAKVILYRSLPGSGYSGKTIWGAQPGAGADDPAAGVLAALTDEEGTVTVRVALGAPVRVFVEREGYVQYGMAFETVKVVKVGDAVRVALEREGMMAGRVVDADSKKPMAGMRVMALAWSATGESRALLPVETVTSDRDGAFLLKKLKPGEFVLEVRPARPKKFLDGGAAEEFREVAVRAYGRTYYPGVERVEEAAPLVLLAGGEMKGLEIRMRPRRVASLRGRMMAADEVTDGNVGLQSTQKQGGVTSYVMEMSAKVQAGAWFRLDGVEPGRYWLSGSAKAGDRALGAFAFFDVDDRNLDGLELALSPGVAMEITVGPDEGLKSLWPAGQKLSVGLQPMGRTHYLDWDRPPLESGAGRFILAGVQGGSYKAWARGLPKGMAVGAVRYNGNAVPGGVVTVDLSALAQRVELVVHEATASIAVTTKAAKATVVAVRVPYDREGWHTDAKTAECDGEGRGAISGLLAGTYRVMAFPAGVAWRTAGGVLLLEAAPKVELGVGANANLELEITRD